MSRWWLVVCLVTAARAAAFPSLPQLFTRPYAWGTPPERVAWAKDADVLVFTWNDQGNRFRDLYAFRPGAVAPVRLTALEKLDDDINASEAEKDDRLRAFLPPQPGISAYDLSRDGKRVAFAHRGDLYVVNTDGRTPPLRLTRTRAPELSPSFSPDATRLASIRGGQIIVQDLATGQIWQPAEIEGGALVAYQWSPAGSHIAYVTRQGTLRQLPLPNYSGRLVSARNFTRTVAGDEPPAWSIGIVPAAGGKPMPVDAAIPARSWLLLGPEWSPDSTQLFLAAVLPSMKKLNLSVIDAKTGKGKLIHEEEDSAWTSTEFAAWSPDSRSLLFLSDRDGWSHLYKIAAAGGKPEQITRGAWEIHSETFSEDPQWIGEWIYYASTEGDTAQRHFYRIHPDGSGKQKLSAREGLNIGLVSPSGRHTAWRYADVKNPLDLWVDTVRVTQSPRPEFAQIAWPETRFVSFPSRGDGKQVSAKMLLPPGYHTAGKARQWPAVFFIHGAGYATSVLKQWGSYNELRFVYNTYLASLGYVVIDIDYRGSSGYGRDWRTGIYLHMGGHDLNDVLGGVDYLKSLGNIDTARLGVWGVSYGGFLTNMALFLSPGTFRAGSSWASVNDWENYNAFYTPQRLGTPQSNPEAYRRSSPIYFSGNLKDKLLIVHGMVDDNVLFQDAVQLSEKLIQEGKDFSQIYYPEESHGFVRDETWIDALRRTTEWFQQHLK